MSRFSDPQSGYAVPSVPEADGFLYLSRFTGDTCVAVFQRAFGNLSMLNIDELVRYAESLDALDDYGIVLTEPLGSGG